MNPQHFTFPPPPPPPPPTAAPPIAAQNYPAYTHTGGNHTGYGANRNRGDRGNRGYHRGNNRAFSRGGGSAHSSSGSSGYPVGGNRAAFQPNTAYTAQLSGQGGNGYTLPDYLPVQLPQYPANVGQEYGASPSTFAPSTALARTHPAVPPMDMQNTAHQSNAQRQYGSRGFDSPNAYNQHGPYQSQNHASYKPQQKANFPQPVLMGPPIRMGFDEHRESRQTQHQPYPPVMNAPNSYQNGTYNGSGSPYPHNSSTDGHPPRHDSPNSFAGHRGGQKRRHGDAFGKSRNNNPKGQAAPAVPSFGAPLPLPVKPPVPLDNPKKSKKKKRRHNQLGLTPRAVEHESSEEDDDVDEEARLAAAVAGSAQGSQLLQFEYKGRTSTLQSSSDITAWIEERKKRFPTKARIAEMAELKRQRQEAQKAASLERREAQERQRAEVAQKRKEKSEADQEHRRDEKKPKDSEEAAAKAKRKVEKLRKQLEREERRAAKAEARASKQKLKVDADEGFKQKGPPEATQGQAMDSILATPGQPSAHSVNETNIKIEPMADTKAAIPDLALSEPSGQVQEPVNIVPDPLTPTSQPPALDEVPDTSASTFEDNGAGSEVGKPTIPDRVQPGEPGADSPSMLEKASLDSSVSMSDSSSDLASTESSDMTSSSGSSSSDSMSEDDGPDQASSRRTGPEKVPPPPRVKAKQICRDFLRQGRCKRGDNCRFLHELPEKGSHSNRKKEGRRRAERTAERVGLYQRLIEQEKETEDHEVLKAIIHLGESGHFNPESFRGTEN